MNEVFTEKLAASATRILEWVESTAVPFASEQIPEVLSEILNYYFYYHLTYIVLAALPLMALLIAYAFAIRHMSKTDDFDEVTFCVGFMGFTGVFLAFPAVCILVSNLLSMIQIAVAPRLFLIEYLRGLV